MKHKKSIGMLLVVCMMMFAYGCGKKEAGTNNVNATAPSESEVLTEDLGIAGVYGELYETESSGSGLVYLEGISEEETVRLTANVTGEMTKPEFWMGSSAGTIIMTQEQIREFNRKMMDQFAPAQVMFDLQNMKSTISGNYVKQLIEGFSIPARNYYYVEGEKLTADFQNEIASQRNLSAVQGQITIRYGIAVDRTDIRAFPTEKLVTDNARNLYYDIFQNSELFISEPVAILHTSLNGEWFFVFSDRSFGWVKADTVALCGDKEQWLQWQKDENVLVVTGKRVTLDKNPYEPGISQTVLTMGSVLQIASEEEVTKVDYDRVPYGCITVKLPVRNEEGYLDTTYAYIPMGEDISFGYLDYTEENILKQSFKMLGTTYGWGGILDVTDCSGYTYQVYRCFGFRFPRNSGQQASIPGTRYNISKKTSAEKKTVLDQLPPGSLLRFPGHMMMYLGQRNGKYYVISALSNFVPEDAETNEAIHPRSIMINTLDVRRLDGTTWLDNLTTICVIN